MIKKNINDLHNSLKIYDLNSTNEITLMCANLSTSVNKIREAYNTLKSSKKFKSKETQILCNLTLNGILQLVRKQETVAI